MSRLDRAVSDLCTQINSISEIIIGRNVVNSPISGVPSAGSGWTLDRDALSALLIELATIHEHAQGQPGGEQDILARDIVDLYMKLGSGFLHAFQRVESSLEHYFGTADVCVPELFFSFFVINAHLKKLHDLKDLRIDDRGMLRLFPTLLTPVTTLTMSIDIENQMTQRSINRISQTRIARCLALPVNLFLFNAIVAGISGIAVGFAVESFVHQGPFWSSPRPFDGSTWSGISDATFILNAVLQGFVPFLRNSRNFRRPGGFCCAFVASAVLGVAAAIVLTWSLSLSVILKYISNWGLMSGILILLASERGSPEAMQLR